MVILYCYSCNPCWYRFDLKVLIRLQVIDYNRNPSTASSTLVELTTRLDFFKERRSQLMEQLHNLDLNYGTSAHDLVYKSSSPRWNWLKMMLAKEEVAEVLPFVHPLYYKFLLFPFKYFFLFWVMLSIIDIWCCLFY